MPESDQAVLVRLEFARVQTYLFEVPELKSMIGANATLGEVLRGRLFPGGFATKIRDNESKENTARELAAGARPFADNLPALAVQCGARLPAGVNPEGLGVPAGEVAAVNGDANNGDANNGDANNGDANNGDANNGDPASLDDNPRAAWGQGILVRDAGRLHAVFPTEEQAAAFFRHAEALVGERLPGVLVKRRQSRLTQGEGGVWILAPEKEEERNGQSEPAGVVSVDLPPWQVCQVTGNGPAAERDVQHGDELENRPRFIAASVKARRKAADHFNQRKTQDLLGLLWESVLASLGIDLEEANARKKNPLDAREFTDIAGEDGRLAVIVADGNGIGQRSMEWREAANDGDFFAREARGERFYHRMRGIVRKALLSAIGATFKDFVTRHVLPENSEKKLPFRLLMLGGDDLLLVCNARFAPQFVIEYAQALHDAGNLEPDARPDIGPSPLDVGIGVAIVKPKFPFHRSHALAEQLAASAKRLYRASPELGSTVDWLAITEAWHDDLAEVRRRDFIRRYQVGGAEQRLVLSRRPYRVLAGRLEGPSLESLRKAAVQLTEPSAPARTQLNALADYFHQGRRLGTAALERVFGGKHQDIKRLVEWQGGDPDWSTTLFDLLELYALAHEGLSSGEEPPAQQPNGANQEAATP